MPFDVCGAMSQGYIGYHIQQVSVLKESLHHLKKFMRKTRTGIFPVLIC